MPVLLIEIDRSIGRFDRALTGLAIDFRGAFRSRAGGFAAAMVSTYATAIALMIANAAMATAARWRTTAVVSRCAPRKQAAP